MKARDNQDCRWKLLVPAGGKHETVSKDGADQKSYVCKADTAALHLSSQNVVANQDHIILL